jgi:hypothetical protein
MMRALGIAIAVLVLASPARAEDGDAAYDPTIDECAEPGAGCLPDPGDPDDAALEEAELAAPADDDPIEWAVDATAVVCPDGATRDAGGLCIAGDLDAANGGCATGGGTGLVVGGALAVLVVLARRRRALLAAALIACAVDAGGWDDAVQAGATGDPSLIDVHAAELGDGDGDAAQLVLAHQAIAAGAQQPAAVFALSRVRTARPIFRAPSPAGDRLVEQGDELIGWARDAAGDGTAELVELQAPGGAYVYETAPESIAALVADGFAITNRLGHVWPPGLGDAPIDDDTEEPLAQAATTCRVTKRSPLFLLYASPGADESERFLLGCHGEVLIGEKREGGPIGRMRTAEAQAAGGRTAFVLDNHGIKLRDLLLRSNGVERTAAYLRRKLALGYDYIVHDEITAAPEWRDGATANRRLRKLLLRLPPRIFVPYISIDLVQHPGGFDDLRARKLLMRAFKRRARMLALEVYLHTPQVMAGAAPSAFRVAADRLALSVRGLKFGGGINRRAITVIGTSMHSQFPQYRYLDQPSHDLESITRQASAIRHGSKRVRQQRGLGYYFVNKSDMAPPRAYSYDRLIRRLRLQERRFR